MTLAELGSHAKHLADSIVARDWMAVLNEVPAVQVAISEVISGWLSPTPHMLSASPKELTQLDGALNNLDVACKDATAEYQVSGVGAKPVGVGIDPATILMIIQMVQTIAELIRRLRERV